MIIGIDASRAQNHQKTGVEQYAFHIIQELKTIIPNDVHVVIYSREPLIGDLAELPENWTSKLLSWPPKRLWTQMRMSWEMLVCPPDVLFIPAHVAPLIHPKKTVVMVHDIAAVRFPGSYSRFERWYSLWFARNAVKNMWRVIVPSAFTAREITGFINAANGSPDAARGARRDEYQAAHRAIPAVIHHGYDVCFNVRHDTKAVARALETYKIKKPFILSIGRLEEKKNTVRMIQAFSRAKEETRAAHQLILAGKPGYGYEQVAKALQESRYKQDIVETGWVDGHDLPLIMSAADIFLFPSLYEGFGIPLIEAQASGVPVIASAGSSLEEIGGDAAFYVDPLDVLSIARGLSELIRSPEIREQYRVKGLKQAAAFSWADAGRKTWDVLKQAQQ